MLYYPNFFIDFLIIFPILRVTQIFTVDFFFLVTLHNFFLEKICFNSEERTAKKFYLLSQQIIFFKKKLVSKSYLHIRIFENVLW